MQRAAEPGHRLGAPALDTGVLPSAAARRQTALHAATERITWVRAGWEVAAQRGVACTCDESHRSAAAWRRHCRSWRIDHRAYHRQHCGRGIQRPALLSPTARLQGYPEPANVPNLLLPNHGARWRIVARGPVTHCQLLAFTFTTPISNGQLLQSLAMILNSFISWFGWLVGVYV